MSYVGSVYSRANIGEPITALNDSDLVRVVEELEHEKQQLNLENMVLEDFLRKGEPSLIFDMERVLEIAARLKAQEAQEAEHKLSHETIDKLEDIDIASHTSAKSSVLSHKSVASSTKIAAILTDKGPRINLTTKIDMVMRVMEDVQISLDNFTKRSKRIKANLKAKSEGIDITLAEVQEAATNFKEEVVTQGQDPITGKIAAERFVRYMEDWLRNAEFLIGKMRLRTGTLKALALKLNQQKNSKEELAEKIDPIDFDQLRIENQNLKEKFERKKSHLIEMKTINGRANLVLSKYKLFLLGQMSELNGIISKIKEENKYILNLDKLEIEAEREAQEALEKLERIQELVNSFRVPSVMEYIRQKADLDELQKNITIYKRRNDILKWKLNTITNKLKVLTGNKKQKTSWFVINRTQDDYDAFLREYTTSKTHKEVCEDADDSSCNTINSFKIGQFKFNQ